MLTAALPAAIETAATPAAYLPFATASQKIELMELLVTLQDRAEYGRFIVRNAYLKEAQAAVWIGQLRATVAANAFIHCPQF